MSRSRRESLSNTRWTTTIGEVCDRYGGNVQTGPFGSQLHASDYSEDGTPVVMPQDMYEGRIICDRIARVGPKYVAQLKRHVLHEGDIVYSRRGDVTRFAVVTKAEQGWLCGTGSIRIRLNSPHVLTGYLRRYLHQESVGNWLKHHAKGVTMRNLNTDVIRALPFVCPPLTEQRRIATVIDRAESLINLRLSALGELNLLTQSVFHKLFGDVAKNDKRWPTQPMGELITIRRGGSPRPIEKYLGGDINWIKIGDATRGSDIYLERCADKITKDGLKKTVFLKAGSLIFANCGVSLGFARILKIDGCIHDGWLSFENIPESKLDKLFLLKALNSITEYFRRIAPAGTQPNLNTNLMKRFRMILPPISVQREFANQVKKIEKLKEVQRTSLTRLETLFASVQERAFRGKL